MASASAAPAGRRSKKGKKLPTLGESEGMGNSTVVGNAIYNSSSSNTINSNSNNKQQLQ